MEFKSGCSSCGEAWLGPGGLGEKACDPMRSSSCNPFWWNSTCAGERLGSGCWRNVWKIWCGAYWFCFNCPGTSIHVKFLARYHVEWHEAWSMVMIWLEIELNTYTHRHKYTLTLTHGEFFGIIPTIACQRKSLKFQSWQLIIDVILLVNFSSWFWSWRMDEWKWTLLE